ncbi:secretion protein F [Enterocloster clostridioformis]|uniref:secretion protein F n=1 Tax=Enterocloster clostridioformis TaxID=1531 RepID=UPI0026757CBF|nr:secretion protein F [Enterocloster clostridioformis]
MSVLLLLLFGGFLFLGMFFLAADLLKVPYMKTEKALLDTGRNRKKGSAALDTFLLQGAMRLSHVIRMDEYRKSRMKNVLKATGIKMTPEVYQAYALTKAGLLMGGIIPCLFLFPLLTPIIVFLAVMVYFKEIQRADEMLKTKRKSIEDELPRFVANLEQELQNNRDVLSMVENFRKNAGVEFGEELGVLVADMRSSSYEAALTRFEARLNSPMLSDVVRGLIGVLRGDNSVVYFQMLAHDFKQLELQKLKSEAQKIPPKIRFFSFLMLMCFLLTYLAIIVFEIIKSLGGMF